MDTTVDYERLQQLPRSISTFEPCWLVGGAAKWLVGRGEMPRDWDIFVEFNNWHRIARSIPCYAAPNTFGGWKFGDGLGHEIDIWPSSLEGYVLRRELSRSHCVVHLPTRLCIQINPFRMD